ncbi:PREDICTED: protein NLP6-like [Ipomoea nil]|uniref:protein NLP6-like n=1 Tax=Ipomoea nil TaxID=35883 RepID=UPI000900EC19|nr:PREDICTED: protein NLP6-like [Ipomoea nil]
MASVDAQSRLSIPDFLNFLPTEPKVSYSYKRPSSAHLQLFWTHQKPETLKEKIKSALQLLDLSYFPTLVQFWAPKIIKDQCHLTTSDQPFGLTVLRKGLCSYRKLCVGYEYFAGEELEGNLGPPGRVFRNGFDEFCPDVRFYDKEDYPLRESALGCGIGGSLALPVFEATGERCIGVLEFVTVWDGSYCLTDYIWRIRDALKGVGLRCLDVCRPFDINGGSERLKDTLEEIEKVLEVVCNKHKMPLAQTWFPSSDGIHTESVMMTTKKGSYVLGKRISSFQKDCTYFPIKKGQGVVGNAFLSRNLSSCKDLTCLSINEYPFAPGARKVGLTSSFAVCLKSMDSENDVYVIEFFLSDQPACSQSQTSLDSLAVTINEHFHSFNIAAAENFHNDVKMSEDEKLEDPPSKEKMVALEGGDTGSDIDANLTKLESSEDQGGVHLGDDESQGNNTLDADQKGVGFGSQEKEDNIQPSETGDGNANSSECIPSKRLTSEHESDPGGKKQKIESFPMEQSCDDTTPANCPDSVSSPMPQATTSEDKTRIPVKVVHKDVIIKFLLSLSSGIVDFEGEVISRMKLEAKSFLIKCQDKDENWLQMQSDMDLQNYMNTMRTSGQSTVKFFVELITN